MAAAARTYRARAKDWLRMFTDGRTLCGVDEYGVHWDPPPCNYADGTLCATTKLRLWADVEADLRARPIIEPSLSPGEQAAKRALAALVVLALASGCARYTQPDRVIELPLKERVELARDMFKLGDAPPAIRVDEEGRVVCRPDTRWGKCEEHGEWLASPEIIRIWRDDPNMLGVGSWLKGLRAICPRGHYVERELGESEEKK